MASNVGQRADEERVVHRVETPEDFVLERDLWLYGKRSPTSDLKAPETPTDIVRSNICTVCQDRKRAYGEL